MTSPAHSILLAPAGSLTDQTAPALDFDSVYREQARFVWRSLSRLGVAAEHLPDALQDVFIVVHRKLGGFEGRSSVRTWLFGIAMRVASDWARRQRRHPSEPLLDTLRDSRDDAPFERAARSEALTTLHRMLDELTPDQRAVFVLVELEQMSVAEAASAVSSNVHTVTSRLKVARQRFEAALRRHRALDKGAAP
ncbi:MAG: sigma-70 family RNA polymerase sigma factor [Polyangiaceae bacterium]